jgi:hypothetical protein
LTSLVIPNSVTSIGQGAFQNCSGLTSLVIPNSVTSIGQEVFKGCSGLTSVAIPNSVVSIGYSAFENCSGLTSVKIPNHVAIIESAAFWGCSGLISVTIFPQSVVILPSAFSSCTSLTDVYCHAEDVPWTLGDIFYNVKIEEATLHVPIASVAAYNAAEPWKNFGYIVPLTPEEETNDIHFSEKRNFTISSNIYTPDGISVNFLQKGMNIIRYTDGKVTKVLVK